MPDRSESDRSHRRARVIVEVVIAALALALLSWAWFADPFWMELHAEPYRCVRDARLLKLGAFYRWLAVLIGAFLLIVGRPLLGRRVARLGISLAGVARISLAVILALVVSELVLRKPLDVPTPTYRCPMCPSIRASERYGWELTPSTTSSWNGPVGPVVTVVDAFGDRVRAAGAELEPGKPTIIVGGESIALGLAIPYEDTFAARLERDLGVQVVIAAVYGHNMGQAYLHEEDTVARFSHVIAIVTTFVPEQVERPQRDTLPTLRFTSTGEVLERPTPEWIRRMQLRRLWRGIYHSDAAIDELRPIVRATLELAKRRGAYPLFLTTNFREPCLWVEGQSPALFRTLFDDQNAPRVHVDLDEGQHAPGDPHPGALSNERLAAAVEGALRGAHVLPRGSPKSGQRGSSENRPKELR